MHDNQVKLIELGAVDNAAYDKITAELIDKKVAALEEKGLPGKEALKRLKEAVAAHAKGQ